MNLKSIGYEFNISIKTITNKNGTLHINTWYQQDGYCNSRDKSKFDLHIQKIQSHSNLQRQAETVMKLECFKKLTKDHGINLLINQILFLFFFLFGGGGGCGVFITQILNNRQKYSHEKTIHILIVNTTSSTFDFTIRIIINREKMGSQAALTKKNSYNDKTRNKKKNIKQNFHMDTCCIDLFKWPKQWVVLILSDIVSSHHHQLILLKYFTVERERETDKKYLL